MIKLRMEGEITPISEWIKQTLTTVSSTEDGKGTNTPVITGTVANDAATSKIIIKKAKE